jgi:cytochrome P450
MTTPSAQDDPFDSAAIVRSFDFAHAPSDFVDNPYRYYAALRTDDPVHHMPSGVLLTRYDDIVAVYRDPRASSDKVVREPNRHVAFGHGIHARSGMNVARMEARIAFSRLLARLQTIELAGEPQRDARIRFRGFRNLPVRAG